MLRVGHAAVALHDQKRPFEPAVLQFRFQAFEIAFHRRAEITVQDRRVRARVLTGDLRQRAAEGPVNLSLRVGFGSKRANFFFVFGVCPGVHQAHGDGIDFVFFDQAPDGVHDIEPVERDDFIPLVVHALAHADDALARREWIGLGDPGDMLDLVVGKTVDPPNGAHDLRGVFEALGGNEADLAAVVGDKRVGGHRAAMFEKRRAAQQFGGVDAHGARRLLNRVHHAARKIIGRCRSLRRPHFAAVAEHDDVGESSAGVHADDVTFLCCHENPFKRRYSAEI